MGLPAELRLRRSPEITAVVRRGRRVRAGGLVVHGLLRPHAADHRGAHAREPGRGPRVAFVAPRTCGPAVRRNRARRRVQEAVRGMVASRTLTADVDLVVRLLPEATEAGSADIARWVAAAVRRLGATT